MNIYDQLLNVILNRILMLFGLRIADNQKVVFVYRIRNYNDSEQKEHVHVIKLTKDVSKAFEFLHMDLDDYKKQQFKSVFDFTDWLTTNCRYLTVDIVRSIEKEIDTIPEKDRTQLHDIAKRFADTVRIGHIVLRDFQYEPLFAYPNLKEIIVRNFFDDDKVQKEFVDLKLKYLSKTDVAGKFSPKLIVTWIKPLRSKPSLTSIFSRSFVDYVTQSDMSQFPRFLVDTDSNIVKKEVLSYYYNIFPHSATYLAYALSDPEANEVK